MQVRRDLPVLQAEDGLDDAGDARRRLQVADVGLDRADEAAAGPRAGRCRAPSPRALCLDGVADGRARAVGLDVLTSAGATPARP